MQGPGWRTGLAIGLLLAVGAQVTAAQAPVMKATAELKNAAGDVVGRARLEQTPTGVLITLSTSRLPDGIHAFHVHETGDCTAPTFASAGGHFNPGQREHGFLSARGPHAGDMPNVHVDPTGTVEMELFLNGVTLSPGANALLDQDGAALVLHAGADDYTSQPAGDAGARIACGVVVADKAP
jgi:Cu-Zn family superoxide dismutase